jgi:hypothetical protein
MSRSADHYTRMHGISINCSMSCLEKSTSVRLSAKTYFQSYGLLDGVPYAELNRNFARECLEDALDIAPNLVRSNDSGHEYIWGDTSQAAIDILQRQARELQRLIDLPIGSVEWIPKALDNKAK